MGYFANTRGALIAMSKALYVAIEGGGTKFVVSVGDKFDNATTINIPTESPSATMHKVIDFINNEAAGQPITAIGLASFGPIGINSSLPDYGVIGKTPKTGWSGFNYFEELSVFNAPIAIDSDVNGAALGESRCGVGKDKNRIAYITVGTGVGGGFVANSAVLNGIGHPELGHILVPRHPRDLLGSGCCPFHNDCLEGLASGPSIYARWGKDLSQLHSSHVAHELEAYYLASMCVNVLLQFVPDVIILGGGVMKTPGLIERVRETTVDLLGGYMPKYDSKKAIEKIIVPPLCEPVSGLVGAFEMAYDLLR